MSEYDTAMTARWDTRGQTREQLADDSVFLPPYFTIIIALAGCNTEPVWG